MGKRISLRSRGSSSGAGAGGIFGTGLFGMFGTVVQCKSDDTSMFCSLSKIVNTLMMVLFLLFILYIFYMLIKYLVSGKKSGGLGPRTYGGYVVGSRSRFIYAPKNAKK